MDDLAACQHALESTRAKLALLTARRDRLAAAAHAEGATLTDLANRLGVSRQAVAKMIKQ